MYKIDWHKKALIDYTKLDGSQKQLVDKGIDKISLLGMKTGKNLAGDLKSCREIKLRKAGLRTIFRQSSEGIEIIEIIAIGKRDEYQVFKEASRIIRERS